MVKLLEVTEIGLDTENPFKHEIVYYINDKVTHRIQVPAYKSREMFASELKRWGDSQKG